jgi:transcriptional repressor NrdR
LDEIEMQLLNFSSVEIPSKEIGRIVMEKLKDFDEVAYIRFATVYLDIKSINDFQELINSYKGQNK